MVRRMGVEALRLDFGAPRGTQRNLRLATAPGALRGPDKYRVLDLKRRRAQMRARRVLGLID